MAIQINGDSGISGVNGSAGTPALQGTDSNTGIVFGTDTVQISTGGSTRATVDSSGRLLVGTTTEGAVSGDNLTIAASANCGMTIRSGINNFGSIYFSDATSGGGEYDGYIAYSQPNRFMQFATGQAERMRIDSSGNLLIGTSVSNTNYRLTINDPGDSFIAIRSDAAADATSQALDFGVGTGNRSSTNLTAVIQSTIHSQSGGTLKSDLSFFTNAGNSITERLKIDSAGNVGIGTLSPTTPLQVHSSTTASTIRITNATSGATSSDGLIIQESGNDAYIWNKENSFISLGTNNAERMRIQSGGGISFNGDTAAANALDDYEEGTWTPTYSSGITNPGYNIQSANYTKIGSLVTFTLNLRASSGTNAGSMLKLSGLPFTPSSSKQAGGAFFNYRDDLTTNVAPFLHIPLNQSLIQFYTNTGSGWNGTDGNGIINRNLHIQGYYYV